MGTCSRFLSLYVQGAREIFANRPCRCCKPAGRPQGIALLGSGKEGIGDQWLTHQCSRLTPDTPPATPGIAH